MTTWLVLLNQNESGAFSRIVSTIALLTYLLGLVTLLSMIFWERRETTSIIAWGFVLFLVPFGFLLYLFLGKGPSFGKRRKTFNALYYHEQYLTQLRNQFRTIEGQDDRSDEVALMKFNILSNYSIATQHNRVRLYPDVRQQYEEMFRDIGEAKTFVNVLYFIIQPDEWGKKLRDLLTEKAKAGVTVRLVYDQVGSRKIRKRFFRPLIRAGGRVEVFFPSWLKFVNRNINYRNHRKMVVIDNRIGYMGGANIGREYVGGHRRIRPWRDTHLRIEGEAVAMLNFRFLQDFAFASKERSFRPMEEELRPVPVEEHLLMQIVSGGPDRKENEIEDAYLKAIYAAKRRIWMQTPYLIPDEKFLTAVKCAAKTGVDVRIMIPALPDKKYAYYATLSYAEELKKSGVRILMRDGFLHAKTLLIDDAISSVGTFNLDVRSFRLHFEITAFVFDKAFAGEMEACFEADEQVSAELTDEIIENRSIFQRFSERLMRLLSPLM